MICDMYIFVITVIVVGKSNILNKKIDYNIKFK